MANIPKYDELSIMSEEAYSLMTQFFGEAVTPNEENGAEYVSADLMPYVIALMSTADIFLRCQADDGEGYCYYSVFKTEEGQLYDCGLMSDGEFVYFLNVEPEVIDDIIKQNHYVPVRA